MLYVSKDLAMQGRRISGYVICSLYTLNAEHMHTCTATQASWYSLASFELPASSETSAVVHICVCKKMQVVYKHIAILSSSMAINHSDAKFPPFIS